MSEAGTLPEELRALVGRESPPVTVVVDTEQIRRFADAIGDPNPLYYDEEYARSKGFRSIIAPPTFLTTIGRWPWQRRDETLFRIPYGRVAIHGEQEYEWFLPIQAGDVVTVTSRIVDIYEKAGRTGRMLFVVTESRYTNHLGQLVAIGRSTGIRR